MEKFLTHFYWYGFAANGVFYACVKQDPSVIMVIFAGLFSWGGFIGSLASKVIA